jgi:hypothetical protein
MVVSFLALTALVSQSLFARTFGGTGDDGAYSLSSTADSGMAIAGYTTSSGAGGADLLVIKVSSLGVLQWARTFGGAGDDWASSIVETSDSGLAIAGYTTSSGAGGVDLLVIKVSSLGVLQWARTFGGLDDDRAYSIVGTSDGGLAIAGYTMSFGAGGTDFLVVKLSSSGNLDWARTFGGSEYDWASCLTRTYDGGLAVAGYTASFGDGGADFLVIKLSSSGNLDWAKTFGGVDDEWAYSIAGTTAGDLALAGYTSSFSVGPADALVFRINSSGDLQWARAVGGGASDYACQVAVCPDNGLAFAGYTSSFGAGWGDILAFKTNSSGNFLWARTFGGTDDDQPSSLISTPGGGIALAGRTISFGAGSWDCVLLEMDTGGNYAGCVYGCAPTVSAPFLFTTLPTGLANCTPTQGSPGLSTGTPGLTVTDACPPAVEEREPVSGPGISCSPVPGGVLFISPMELSLRIYSAEGRLAYAGELVKGENRIILETGVYFWMAGTYKGKAIIR